MDSSEIRDAIIISNKITIKILSFQKKKDGQDIDHRGVREKKKRKESMKGLVPTPVQKQSVCSSFYWYVGIKVLNRRVDGEVKERASTS